MVGPNWSQRDTATAIGDWLREFRADRIIHRARQPIIYRVTDERFQIDVFAGAREPVTVTPVPGKRSQEKRRERQHIYRGRWVGRFAHRAKLIQWLQGGNCYLCDSPMDVRKRHWKPTIEHVTPQSAGGLNRGNILIACSFCNNVKANRMPKPCEMLYLGFINEVMPVSGRSAI